MRDGHGVSHHPTKTCRRYVVYVVRCSGVGGSGDPMSVAWSEATAATSHDPDSRHNSGLDSDIYIPTHTRRQRRPRPTPTLTSAWLLRQPFATLRS